MRSSINSRRAWAVANQTNLVVDLDRGWGSPMLLRL
jgi:hypothetical protein